MGSSEDQKTAEVTLRLDDSPATRDIWPHAFSLLYTVTLTDNSLSMRLEVTNKGEQPFSFTGALHTYLQVGSVAHAFILGLGGLRYEDNTAGLAVVEEIKAESLTISGEVDRVYIDAPESLHVRAPRLDANGQPILSDMRTLQIRKDGFRDTVLWNIGESRAPTIVDLGAGEWQRYVCVEAAAAASPVELLAGGTFVGTQTLTAV